MNRYKIFYKDELVDVVPANSSEQAISIMENMLQISIRGNTTYFNTQEIKQNIFQKIFNEFNFWNNVQKFFIDTKRNIKMATKIKNKNEFDHYKELLIYAVKNKSLEVNEAEKILSEGLDSIKRWSQNHPY